MPIDPQQQQSLNELAEDIAAEQIPEFETPDAVADEQTRLEQERQRKFAFDAECGQILAQRQTENLSPTGCSGYQSSGYIVGGAPTHRSWPLLMEVALDVRAAILQAALKYRAIARNRPGEVSLEAHMATDDRVVAARLRMERELVSAGLLDMNEPDFALNLIPQGLQVQTPSKTFLIPL